MKHRDKKKLWDIVIWGLIVSLILTHSVRATYTVDFFAINGTFQNFNPIRRLLAGELPYKDFTIYLGLGHLFMGSIFTALFGGDFSGSLVAFSFLTLLAFCLIAFSLGKVVLGKSKAVYVTTLSMVVILLVQPLFFTSAGGLFAEIVSAMGAALSPGNSARFIRGMILPLSVLVGMYSLGKIKWLAEQKKWSESRYNTVLSMAHGVISGVCFIWSNDYGIACWICSLVVQIMINAKRTKSFAAVTAEAVVQIVISLFTIFAIVEAVTLGNFSEWLHSLFGIGSFQKWYFGTPHYLWDIDLSFLTLLQAVITIFYLGKMMLGDQKELAKYAALAYANMVCYAAVNEYALFNNGGLYEIAYTVLFFTMLYEVLNALKNIDGVKQLKYGIKTASIITACAVLCSISSKALLDFTNRTSGGGGILRRPWWIYQYAGRY